MLVCAALCRPFHNRFDEPYWLTSSKAPPGHCDAEEECLHPWSNPPVKPGSRQCERERLSVAIPGSRKPAALHVASLTAKAIGHTPLTTTYGRMVALSILFRILAALLGAAMAGVAPIIDTKVLGKGIKPFGGDLEKHTWRSFKFVYMNYVGAVSSELREHMKAAADHPASVPLSCMAPEIRHESNTLAYMLSQVLEGAALVMIMNIEEGNGFEM